MLRFDLPPVWSNVIRWEAFLTSAICLLALWLSPWMMFILVVQAFLRGFVGHRADPLNPMWVSLFKSLNLAGKQENAGAKMFAVKLLFIGSSATLLLLMSGASIWMMPIYVLLFFSVLEWAFGFCAGCWAYTFWHQARQSRA